MSVRVRVLIAVLLAGALIPSSASAWHYTFHDFFDIHHSPGGSTGIGAGFAEARKCGPGGKLGTYDYRSSVLASGGQTELEFQVVAKLSVRENFRQMEQVEVKYSASPNFPPEIADEAANALHDFHETVFTRYRQPNKLLVRHGSLVIFGTEVVAPDEVTTKFKPKPGC